MTLSDRDAQSDDTTAHALAQISKQATTGSPISPSPDDWINALPQLDGVACKWQMEDSLTWSYLWYEGEAFRAASLPSGLEDKEGQDLSRHEAGGLLDSGVRHRPADQQEARDAE